MGKFVDAATVQDALLDAIAACNVQHMCTAQPASYAGIAALSLGSVTMVSGDFTKAAGDVNGRKLTVGAKSGVTVTTAGTGTHLVLARTTDSTLRAVTTCPSAAVGAGGTFDIAAWKAAEVADPV